MADLSPFLEKGSLVYQSTYNVWIKKDFKFLKPIANYWSSALNKIELTLRRCYRTLLS